jgi:hypothetical protein
MIVFDGKAVQMSLSSDKIINKVTMAIHCEKIEANSKQDDKDYYGNDNSNNINHECKY